MYSKLLRINFLLKFIFFICRLAHYFFKNIPRSACILTSNKGTYTNNSPF